MRELRERAGRRGAAEGLSHPEEWQHQHHGCRPADGPGRAGVRLLLLHTLRHLHLGLSVYLTVIFSPPSDNPVSHCGKKSYFTFLCALSVKQATSVKPG